MSFLMSSSPVLLSSYIADLIKGQTKGGVLNKKRDNLSVDEFSWTDLIAVSWVNPAP